MKSLDEYPKRHPETGKVKNPSSGNFVTVAYAERQNFLEEAEFETQRHFSDLDQEQAEDPENEIDALLDEVKNTEPGADFGEAPGADEGEEPLFSQPPTPEGLEEVVTAPEDREGSPPQGVYSGGGSGNQPTGVSSDRVGSTDQEEDSTPKRERRRVKYVRGPAGGQRTIFLDEEDSNETEGEG